MTTQQTDSKKVKDDAGFFLWLTGVPASGKSTIAQIVERELRARGLRLHNFDGDEWRRIMTPDLGYDRKARDQNLHRISYVASVLCREGVNALAAVVSPDREFRDRARTMVPKFVEVWVKADLETVKKRDPKGLYKKGAEGKVNDIPGWHIPFEEPPKPELVIDTMKETAEQSAAKVIAKLEEMGYIARKHMDAYSEEEEKAIRDRLEKLGYL